MNKFCVMPWIGMEINNNGNMRPCCVYRDRIIDDNGNTFNINTHSINEYTNSKIIQTIKADMLMGKHIPGCSKCYEEEKNNINSMRIRKNKEYEYVDCYTKDITDLLTVDLKLSNLCNQKCVICNPVASSMIAAENKVILPEQNKNYDYSLFNWYKIDQIWEQLKEATIKIKHFDFYGGEPWLIKKQWEFINHLIETGQSKDISLNYATNGSIHEDFYFTEYFSKFKRVSILYSADGIDDTFEYCRFPAKWEVFKENIQKAKNYQDQGIVDWVAIAYTVSAYSIYNVIDSLDFYKSINVPVWFNLVNEEEFSPSVLDDETKTAILEYIEGNWKDDFLLIDSVDVSFFRNELTKDIDSKWKDLFKHKINARDAYRNNKLTNILPFESLKNFLEGI